MPRSLFSSIVLRFALPVVIGLTVWFDIIDPLAPAIVVQLGDSADLASIVISYAFYLLGPIRWALVLALLISSVRAHPLPLVPATAARQVGFVVIAQVLLGGLSLMGALMLWVERGLSEQAGGFVLHVVLPTLVVIFTARRRPR